MTAERSTAVRIHRYGGPEVLEVEELPIGEPGPGEVRLRQTAVGLNFIDTYHRTGLYPVDPLPAALGSEGAGRVEAVGPGVERWQVGDRVAYALSRGAYAAQRLIDADQLVRLPETIGDDLAAASMLKGLTAWYLVRETHVVATGDSVLVHAAAGGVGSILCQWAKSLGATVFGTAGTPEKALKAKANGCDEVILYREEDVADRISQATGGRGVDVVYDGVGQATFDASLASLKPRGLLAAFGNASGAVPPFDLLRLTEGSKFVTRPTLATYVAERADLERGAGALFQALESGTIEIEIGSRFPLSEARSAHETLEARRTVGSTLLIP